MPLMIGIYSPKISSSVEPEMPGRTMAQIATAPTKNA